VKTLWSGFSPGRRRLDYVWGRGLSDWGDGFYKGRRIALVGFDIEYRPLVELTA